MKRFNNFSILFTTFFVLITSLTGCGTLFKKEPSLTGSAMLEPSMLLKFTDIPYPSRFKFLSRDSYTFENSGIRVGVLKYKGKANVDQVVNFYKEQMPIYNWNLLNIVEYGERLLNFERENETCIVSLVPKGSSVFITLSLGPKPQIPKRTDKPVK